MTKSKETFNSFMNKVLSGTATAIVVSLIPNAILSTILKSLSTHQFVADYIHVLQIFQYFTAIMAGFLIAEHFKMTPMQQVAIGGAAFIASGAWKFKQVVDQGAEVGLFQLAGIGDLINTMITVSIAILLIRLIGDKFGSLNIILVPMLIGTGVGFLGWLMLPTVSKFTTMIGDGINTFTTLQPYLMSILICMSFALIIVSPISTVAIGVAVGLLGLSSAAAAMGVASTAAFMMVGTYRMNKIGVPAAVALGAIKMTMPNVAANPIMIVGILITSALSALSVPIFGMVGTPVTAGFGFIGLVGPLASLESLNNNFILMLVLWIAVPLAIAFVVHNLCLKFLPGYTREMFIFTAVK